VWFMQLPCCMKPKHVVEEEEENKELHIYGPT
jgi:hypothetical protein